MGDALPRNRKAPTGTMQEAMNPVHAPAPPFSKTTLALVCVVAATAGAAAACAVVLSALRGGVAAGLLAAVVSAPAVLLALVLGVVSATWLCPTGLAAAVQVLAVEVIRLSGAMAIEDEEEWGVRGGEGRGATMARQWAEGRLGQQQFQGQHQQRERGQLRQGEGKMWRRRRVAVEWEAGQMFLEVRRPIASEWLVGLVNRCATPFMRLARSCTGRGVGPVFGLNGSRSWVLDIGSLLRRIYCEMRTIA